MRKFNRNVVLCLLGMVLGGSLAWAADAPTLRPDHPTRYTVQKGDTLWGVSGRYLSEPWRWPQLWQASPQVKPDPNLTVKTALDRAAQRVAGRFDKQPYVEVAIRRTIGWSYRDLGDIPAAQGQFERALEIRRTIREPGVLELLDLTSDVNMPS